MTSARRAARRTVAAPASLAAVAAVAIACGPGAYPAPAGRELPALSPTTWGRTDSGDEPAIRRAEERCRAGRDDRAVGAAFRAVDAVAEALVDLCEVEIVGDDPLAWHVWCGSDATFAEGTYRAPEDAAACGDGTRASAFACIGRILGRSVLPPELRDHIQGVEIVALGSVDRQRLAEDSVFLADPCLELQRRMDVPQRERWEPPEAPSGDERGGIWNHRLSWCRAAYAATELRGGLLGVLPVSVRLDEGSPLRAIGAGTDWLDAWRAQHPERGCPTPPSVSGERGRGQCRDARRVDVFLRVRAEAGTTRPASCAAPAGHPGGRPGEALYCYADCQSRAATGRNPEGYRPPRARPDLLYGTSAGAAPPGWVLDQETASAVNLASVRRLLLDGSTR
ncbi:MAG: hypothetical protein ACFCGT_18685 [Sandaracinaceae bacterium]